MNPTSPTPSITELWSIDGQPVEITTHKAQQLAKEIRGSGGVWQEISSNDIPLGTFIRLGKTPEGKLICTGLACVPDASANSDSDAEVTSRKLRKIQLGAILELIGRVTNLEHGKASLHHAVAARMAKDSLDSTALEVTTLPKRPGRKGWSDDHYRLVAENYKRALVERPRAPVKYLVESMHTSDATARRWISTARDRGYIQTKKPSTKGFS